MFGFCFLEDEKCKVIAFILERAQTSGSLLNWFRFSFGKN